MSPDVITVANVQTGRTFRYTVKAADTELPAELKEHPASYVDGAVFDVIEADTAGDLCNVVTALQTRGRKPASRRLVNSAAILLPIQLPPQG
jgi:hypothetical protein